MITDENIKKIIDLTCNELQIHNDPKDYTLEDSLKVALMNETLSTMAAGIFAFRDGLKVIEIMRITLNGLELTIQENRK